MAVEGLLSPAGLGEMVAGDFFTMQVGVLALTVIAFLSSFVMSLLAFRAASSAKRARIETEAQFHAAQDLAVEIRHLTAQIERTSSRRVSASVPSSPVRVGASEVTDEAEIEIIDARPFEEGYDAVAAEAPASEALTTNDPATDRALDEARTAATVPSALLRGLLRRR